MTFFLISFRRLRAMHARTHMHDARREIPEGKKKIFRHIYMHAQRGTQKFYSVHYSLALAFHKNYMEKSRKEVVNGGDELSCKSHDDARD